MAMTASSMMPITTTTMIRTSCIRVRPIVHAATSITRRSMANDTTRSDESKHNERIPNQSTHCRTDSSVCVIVLCDHM
jgi:hypothetical protein